MRDQTDQMHDGRRVSAMICDCDCQQQEQVSKMSEELHAAQVQGNRPSKSLGREHFRRRHQSSPGGMTSTSSQSTAVHYQRTLSSTSQWSQSAAIHFWLSPAFVEASGVMFTGTCSHMFWAGSGPETNAKSWALVGRQVDVERQHGSGPHLEVEWEKGIVCEEAVAPRR